MSAGPAQESEVINELYAAETRVRDFIYGLFALVVYEHLIILEWEVAYFWLRKDDSKLSRILFFWNRYNLILAISITVYTVWSTNEARWLFILVTFLNTSGVVIIQVMHALRLWYLFSHSIAVRVFLVAVTLGYHLSEWVVVIQDLVLNSINSRSWIPSLIVHSILYVLTVVRAFFPRPSSVMERDHMIWVVRQGGLLASVAFATTLFCTIGALDKYDLSVSLPAQYSGVQLVVMSSTMSRLMFNIHQFSDTLGTEPELLLSHLEMSRIRMRSTKGMHDGELLVEVENTDQEEYELSCTHTTARGQTLEDRCHHVHKVSDVEVCRRFVV